MSDTHHTPHPFGNAVASAEFNSRLGELDAAINTVIAAGLVEASTSLTAQALAGQPVLTVASEAGFLVGDSVWVGTPGSGLQEAGIVASLAPLTLEDNLANTHAIGTPVSRSPVEIVDARDGAATLKTRLRSLDFGWTSARAHGVVGDGVTPDAAAVQSAIDVAEALGHGRVILPPGLIKLNVSLELASRNVELIGAGKQATVLLSPDDGTPAIITNGVDQRGLVLRDMTIKGGNTADSARFLLEIVGVGEDILLDNLLLHGNGGEDDTGTAIGGVLFYNSWMGLLNGVHFEQFKSATAPACKVRAEGVAINTIRWVGCSWQHCMVGVDLHDAADTHDMHSMTFINPRMKRIPMTGSYGIRGNNNAIFGANIVGGFFEDIEFPVSIRGYSWRIDGAFCQHATTVVSVETGHGHYIDGVVIKGTGDNAIGRIVHVKAAVNGPVLFRSYRAHDLPTTAVITDDSKYATPALVSPPYGSSVGSFANLGAAPRTAYIPIYVPQVMETNGVQVVIGTQAGNIGVALYNMARARLATSGAVACPAAGQALVPFTSNVTLTEGWYFIGLSAGDAATTFGLAMVGASGLGVTKGEAVGATPPATATFTLTLNSMPAVYLRPVGSDF